LHTGIGWNVEKVDGLTSFRIRDKKEEVVLPSSFFSRLDGSGPIFFFAQGFVYGGGAWAFGLYVVVVGGRGFVSPLFHYIFFFTLYY
jgi:hypothetical protein